MENFTLPDEWKKIATEILSKGVVTIVLGEVDTGKTTFVTYLTKMAVDSGKVVGVIDADVGQSDIGPPATIGLGIVDRPFGDLESINPSALYFVGSISPERHLLAMVVGTRKMVEKAYDFRANIIIIDTTGLVSGKIGRALKFYKIQGIWPDNIVALQRGYEVEHLLRPFEGLKGIAIHRLPVPNGVKRRSQKIRQAKRDRSFNSFFKDSHILDIPFSKIRTSNTLFLSGRPLSQNELGRLSKRFDEIVLYGERIPEGLLLVLPDTVSERRLSQIREEVFQRIPEDFKRLLVGLGDEDGETISLGIIERIDFSKRVMSIKTPLSSKELISPVRRDISNRVKIIQFSEFKISQDLTTLATRPNLYLQDEEVDLHS